MELQEKLIELSEYGVSFNVANGNFVIRIRYDKRWNIIQPEDKDIQFYRDEADSCVYYYVAPITTNIDKLFGAIDETIGYNKELELKVILFKDKMAELQEIFSQEPLEVLNTLEFKMKRKKANTKKEKNTKEEAEIPEKREDEEPIEDNQEEVSEIDKKIKEVINEE